MVHPPERRLKPVPSLRPSGMLASATSRKQERCPVREFKEMSGEPKSR